jgi:hypothetical protein
VRAGAAIVLAAVLALAGAGCGGGGSSGYGSQGAKTRSTASSQPGLPTIDSRSAIGEARSSASRQAALQDYSISPLSFATSCRAPGGAARSRNWSCTVRSSDRRCRGPLKLLVARSGAVVTTYVALRCTGSSVRG